MNTLERPLLINPIQHDRFPEFEFWCDSTNCPLNRHSTRSHWLVCMWPAEQRIVKSIARVATALPKAPLQNPPCLERVVLILGGNILVNVTCTKQISIAQTRPATFNHGRSTLASCNLGNQFLILLSVAMNGIHFMMRQTSILHDFALLGTHRKSSSIKLHLLCHHVPQELVVLASYHLVGDLLRVLSVEASSCV